MTFGDYFKKGIEIIKLNSDTIKDVSKDEAAFGMALLFVAMAGIAGAIGSLQLLAVIAAPILYVVFYFIGVGILHLLALVFGGKGKYMELMRPMGIGHIIMWPSVVPVIGPAVSTLLALWAIVMEVVVVKNVHELSTTKSIIVVLIPLVVVVITIAALAALIVALLAAVGITGLAGLAAYS